MNNLTNECSLQERLEAYLNKACEAEARGEKAEAEWLLRLAMDCDGTPQSGVGNTSEHVQQAHPLCRQDQVVTPAANLPANGPQTIEAVSRER